MNTKDLRKIYDIKMSVYLLNSYLHIRARELQSVSKVLQKKLQDNFKETVVSTLAFIKNLSYITQNIIIQINYTLFLSSYFYKLQHFKRGF